jgi:hypothetical protein
MTRQYHVVVDLVWVGGWVGGWSPITGWHNSECRVSTTPTTAGVLVVAVAASPWRKGENVEW